MIIVWNILAVLMLAGLIGLATRGPDDDVNEEDRH